MSSSLAGARLLASECNTTTAITTTTAAAAAAAATTVNVGLFQEGPYILPSWHEVPTDHPYCQFLGPNSIIVAIRNDAGLPHPSFPPPPRHAVVGLNWSTQHM